MQPLCTVLYVIKLKVSPKHHIYYEWHQSEMHRLPKVMPRETTQMGISSVLMPADSAGCQYAVLFVMLIISSVL